MGRVDRLGVVLFRLFMSKQTTPAKVTATVTIEGEAAEILAQLRKVRGCKRQVHLVVDTYTPGLRRVAYYSDYSLPVIEGGQTANALRQIVELAHQNRISLDDEKRIGDMIEQFGDLT